MYTIISRQTNNHFPLLPSYLIMMREMWLKMNRPAAAPTIIILKGITGALASPMAKAAKLRTRWSFAFCWFEDDICNIRSILYTITIHLIWLTRRDNIHTFFCQLKILSADPVTELHFHDHSERLGQLLKELVSLLSVVLRYIPHHSSQFACLWYDSTTSLLWFPKFKFYSFSSREDILRFLDESSKWLLWYLEQRLSSTKRRILAVRRSTRPPFISWSKDS